MRRGRRSRETVIFIFVKRGNAISTLLFKLLKWKLKCNAVPSDRHGKALNLNQNGLLLTYHIDNTSLGGAASGGKIVPGPHKTCEWRTETMENTCIYNLYKRKNGQRMA